MRLLGHNITEGDGGGHPRLLISSMTCKNVLDFAHMSETIALFVSTMETLMTVVRGLGVGRVALKTFGSIPLPKNSRCLISNSWSRARFDIGEAFTHGLV